MPLWDEIEDDEEEIQVGSDFEDGKESELICPDCPGEIRLMVRTNRNNGNQFLGCPNWPNCNFTRGIPESWLWNGQGKRN